MTISWTFRTWFSWYGQTHTSSLETFLKHIILYHVAGSLVCFLRRTLLPVMSKFLLLSDWFLMFLLYFISCISSPCVIVIPLGLWLKKLAVKAKASMQIVLRMTTPRPMDSAPRIFRFTATWQFRISSALRLALIVSPQRATCAMSACWHTDFTLPLCRSN